MKLVEIARLLSASHDLSDELAGSEPAGFAVDSRSVKTGEVFVALQGERTDGHQYVRQVFEKGALAAVVAHHRLESLSSYGDYQNRLLFVENPAFSLELLASRILARWGGRVVGITASAGKTTIKDLVAAVLERSGRVIKSLGNFNTTVGLPLTITRMISAGSMPEDFDLAVLEMGMSSFGEISRLVDIAPPDIGVVGNVGVAHIEFFGSQDAIARAKAELVHGIKPGGIAILNADDARVIAMRKLRRDTRVITFGFAKGSDVRASDVQQAADLGGTNFVLHAGSEKAVVMIQLAGQHNVQNALAAAAVGIAVGQKVDEIAQALSQAPPPRMRGEVLRLSNGVTVLDDTYNSNPVALIEAARALVSAKGFKRRIVVAGEMLELGEKSTELHRDCGQAIAKAGVEIVIGVQGEASQLASSATQAGAQSFFFETPDEAAEKVAELVKAGDAVLVKGSRGVRTEKVVENLKSRFGRDE